MDPSIQSQLTHRKENIYFAFVLLFSILTYIFLAFSIIGIVIIAFMVLISVIFHGLMMGGIRRNGVKLSEEQFPDLYEKAVKVATDIGLKKIPDIYVVESAGILNAFATRFFGRNMVVLYSDIFELIEREGEKEVLFVLAHEFTHLKRKHVIVSLLLLPAMWVPFLGNAYMRACEYTCDRYAAYYVQSLDAAKNALTILAIGKELYSKVNQQAYMKQLETESGFFVWLNEKLSSHPHLPKRIYSLSILFASDTTEVLSEPKRKVWIGLIIAMFSTILVSTGLFAGYKTLEKVDMFSEIFAGLEGTTPLMDAASSNDVEELQVLLDEGHDIDEVDNDGSTALHWAVFYNSYEAAEFLLEQGANPNTQDSYDTTPLMSTVFMDDIEMAELLLQYHADLSYVDTDGLTAYDYAVQYESNNFIQLFDSYLQE
ncbi:M48 family metallopeptidase [Cytobacillus sp. FJAT-54145]|uniref:M48 family metallopeptidase n=1 Tax=Cytobacillus spartinae TaxID=3299023 RepID=A0ABW6KKJ0_9BACI